VDVLPHGENGLERLRAWRPNCREPSGLLATMQWSPGIGPHFPVKLVAIATRLEAMSLSPALPSVLAATRPWSVLGPHRIGKQRSSPGTSGNDGFEGIAAHDTFQPWTSAAGAGWRRLRAPPPDTGAAGGRGC
jgi:hypothetical protein